MSTASASPQSTSAAQPSTMSVGRMLVPALLATTLTLGAAGGGVFWLVRSGRLASIAGAHTATLPPPPEAAVASHLLELEPMIVNLSDAGGHSYLRIAVSLRITDLARAGAKEATARPQKASAGTADPASIALRDTTLSVLSRETADSLLAPGGREALKKSLEHEYMLHNADTPVLDVYFSDFMVQRG